MSEAARLLAAVVAAAAPHFERAQLQGAQLDFQTAKLKLQLLGSLQKHYRSLPSFGQRCSLAAAATEQWLMQCFIVDLLCIEHGGKNMRPSLAHALCLTPTETQEHCLDLQVCVLQPVALSVTLDVLLLGLIIHHGCTCAFSP